MYSFARLLVALALVLPTGSSVVSSETVGYRPPVKEATSVRGAAIAPTGASWVDCRNVRKAPGKRGFLRVSSPRYETFVRFSAPRAKAGQTLTLRVRIAKTVGRSNLTAYASSNAWSPSRISCANKPKSAQRVSIGQVRRDGRYLVLRLDEARVKGTVSLRLRSSQSDLRLSRKNLTLRWADAPQPGLPVMAHYFPPYPISFENAPPEQDYYARNYLTIEGEGGKHRAYGGLLRDRPLGRAPSPSPTWVLDDLRREVRQAKSGGLEGFTVDLLGLSGPNWTRVKDLMRAAELEGNFVIMPMVDSTAFHVEVPVLAASLQELFSYSSAYKRNNMYVYSAFGAERESPAYWAELNRYLTARSSPVGFIPCFIGLNDQLLSDYAGASVGISSWGYRTAQVVQNAPDWAAKVHAAGKLWMPTIAAQDARPRSGKYAEASNLDTYQASWESVIEDGADLVQIATWNDYSESTSIAPSMAHGQALLEVTRYYDRWATTGREPLVTEPLIVLSHRVHAVDAKTTSGIENMSSNLSNSTVTPIDRVQAWLVVPPGGGSVTLTAGSQRVTRTLAPGVQSVTLPLGPDPSVTLVWAGGSVTVTSPHRVTSDPIVQDFQYWMASKS